MQNEDLEGKRVLIPRFLPTPRDAKKAKELSKPVKKPVKSKKPKSAGQD